MVSRHTSHLFWHFICQFQCQNWCQGILQLSEGQLWNLVLGILKMRFPTLLLDLIDSLLQGGTLWWITARCFWISEPGKFFVPASAGLLSPGILNTWNIPCILACFTKCTLLSMCREYFVTWSHSIMAIALLESVNKANVSRVSKCFPCRKFHTCFTCMASVIAYAHALYSASALECAIGIGTNVVEVTKDPLI